MIRFEMDLTYEIKPGNLSGSSAEDLGTNTSKKRKGDSEDGNSSLNVNSFVPFRKRHSHSTAWKNMESSSANANSATSGEENTDQLRSIPPPSMSDTSKPHIQSPKVTNVTSGNSSGAPKFSLEDATSLEVLGMIVAGSVKLDEVANSEVVEVVKAEISAPAANIHPQNLHAEEELKPESPPPPTLDSPTSDTPASPSLNPASPSLLHTLLLNTPPPRKARNVTSYNYDGKNSQDPPSPKKKRRSTRKSGGRGKRKTRSDDSPEEEDERLYCLCRKPDLPGVFMIACDSCDEWFHGDCIGISESDAKTIQNYICESCDIKAGNGAKRAKKEEEVLNQKIMALQENQANVSAADVEDIKALEDIELKKKGIANDIAQLEQQQRDLEQAIKFASTLFASEASQMDTSDPSVPNEKAGDPLCGCPTSDFPSGRCERTRQSCSKHANWETLRMQTIEQDKTRQNTMLASLAADEKLIRARISKRDSAQNQQNKTIAEG